MQPVAVTTTPQGSTPVAEAYLDLLVGCLSRTVIPEHYEKLRTPGNAAYRIVLPMLQRALSHWGIELVRRVEIDPAARESGIDWPPEAETMIGLRRLANLRHAVRTVIEEQIAGDFIETGVWRGGACILMRGALRAYGDTTRRVWAADSFEGLPRPTAEKYAADAGDILWRHSDVLAVSLEQVQANFARYGLLDEQVRFLKGWFSQTLPTAPIQTLAILRLDGDMYESTMDAMSSLYDKLSVGGFLIVDDYSLKGCHAAIADYRGAHGIADPIIDIDEQAVYWRKGH